MVVLETKLRFSGKAEYILNNHRANSCIIKEERHNKADNNDDS